MKNCICMLVIFSGFMVNGCSQTAYIPGPMGATGATGVQGATGVMGASCTVSAVEIQEAAPNGGSLISCPDGTQELVLNGSNGTNGVTGTTGSQGAAGVTGATGYNGTDGAAGSTGATGSAGVTGPTGEAGVNGTNGTVVVAVQFCSGTPTYPTTFPEVGFCINNNLWAVYSQNGGFLTELPLGNYSSDGINSSCSFTVGSNCSVSH